MQAVQVLAQAAGHLGMIGGQRMDLENEKMQAEIERVEQTDRLKTGALICAAAKLGCIAAGADEERILLAESYAQKVGLAFQITDDILDCTGDEKRWASRPVPMSRTTRQPMFRCTVWSRRVRWRSNC